MTIRFLNSKTALFVLGGSLILNAHAEAPIVDPYNLQERLVRLERLVEGRKELDLLSKFNYLQVQLRELRGQIEKQDHEIEKLQKMQAQMYTDLEKRVLALEEKLNPPLSPPPSSP